MNIPLKAQTPAAEHARMFNAALEEISSRFRPDLILISAGFDSHVGDPLGQLRLEDSDFVAMTRNVLQWANEACNGRVVSCLEGGYNLDTLGETVRTHVSALESAT
jgi:acetoin utilization deacetylase AcuC-like enzyme